MNVKPLPTWDTTPIEIALDLEPWLFQDSSRNVFRGPWEPRICLVAAFALTSHLKRIVTAVNRAIPARLPCEVKILPSKARRAFRTPPGAIAIAPMLPLLRLQSRLIRAITPGLADQGAGGPLGWASGIDDDAARFVGDFISHKSLPTFEPILEIDDFTPTHLRATGVTLYHLGREGGPQSILGHWAYAQSARGSVHLRDGP